MNSTLTSITLEWFEPSDNGGCPILGYAVYRNDGKNGLITTEVNTEIDTNIRDKPSLRSMVITNFPQNSIGLKFFFQVHVFNEVGNSKSQTVSYILAAVPPPPLYAPTDDILTTNSTKIRVEYK